MQTDDAVKDSCSKGYRHFSRFEGGEEFTKISFWNLGESKNWCFLVFFIIINLHVCYRALGQTHIYIFQSDCSRRWRASSCSQESQRCLLEKLLAFEVRTVLANCKILSNNYSCILYTSPTHIC